MLYIRNGWGLSISNKQLVVIGKFGIHFARIIVWKYIEKLDIPKKQGCSTCLVWDADK